MSEKIAKYAVLISSHRFLSREYVTNYLTLGSNGNEESVDNAALILTRDIIYSMVQIIPPEDTFHEFLNRYPILLLSKICRIDYSEMYFITQLIRTTVIKSSNLVPSFLLDYTDIHFPPLKKEVEQLETHELNSLLGYLGTKKRSFLHLLINLGSENRDNQVSWTTPRDLEKIWHSKWMNILIYLNC